MPANPTRAGYTFYGWYAAPDFSGAPWNFNTGVVTCNMTLYALWATQTLTVSFVANGGAPVPAAQSVQYGGHATEPAAPVRTGFVFGGWYATPDFSGAPWNFAANAVTANTVLYARWIEQVLTVTFNANGGAPTPPAQSVPYGSLATMPAVPTRTGFDFAGWYPTADFSGNPWNFATDVVTANTTLYARWTAQVLTVTFDANGGVPVPAPQMVTYGGLATEPGAMSQVGFDFEGWYPTADFSGDPWDFATDVVTANMTLYANWVPTP